MNWMTMVRRPDAEWREVDAMSPTTTGKMTVIPRTAINLWLNHQAARDQLRRRDYWRCMCMLYSAIVWDSHSLSVQRLVSTPSRSILSQMEKVSMEIRIHNLRLFLMSHLRKIAHPKFAISLSHFLPLLLEWINLSSYQLLFPAPSILQILPG